MDQKKLLSCLVIVFLISLLTTIMNMSKMKVSKMNWKVVNFRNWFHAADIVVPKRLSILRSYPMDYEFLERNFSQLLTAVDELQKFLGPTENVKLNVTKEPLKRPLTNFKNITAHTPSGKSLTLDDVRLAIQDEYVVPSGVHFILPFFDAEIQFHHLVCILSAYWINKPKRLIFWYVKPMKNNTWWRYLKKNITDFEEKVVMIHRPIVNTIYDRVARGKEHQSDFMRMEALLLLGGMYLDLDVVVVKDMNPLRKYDFTIGREIYYGLCNGAMLSAPNSTFLSLWHLTYQSFDDNNWGTHSIKMPNFLQKQFPTLVHVEEESMDRPNWKETTMIYGRPRVWNWRLKNYCMHLWYRFHNIKYDFTSIRYADSMLGDIFRFVLFGNSDMAKTKDTPHFKANHSDRINSH